ncbi:MAG: putative Methylenetetrahydrofolate dehydrogenase [Candidatus Saccharibacteria bacterium]|nr:putative Methylenetetrahydrofolate dehydrogenase [Candidatus Saccharibacteria bacterium]
MRILDGAELAGFIKARQITQVRALRQAWQVSPKLAIIQTINEPVVDMYVGLKQAYGEDILIDVDVHKVEQRAVRDLIKQLNEDELVHGIIVQLPLADPSQTDEVVNLIAPEKDVDGLGTDATMTPATALAIEWLLAGYNVTLKGRQLAIVGNGRLVGAPLYKLWSGMGLDVRVYDDTVGDLTRPLRSAEVVVTATGVPGLIRSAMLRPGAVVVDAGTSTENGKIVGDTAADVRERDDLIITPIRGGVGPLTVTALFDNVIQAARIVADAKQL